MIIAKRQPHPPGSQHGVVLLIVLIMLVAMTLAGIGMMRSVDTASIVAGNLGYKQSTISAADAGTSQAYITLITAANTDNSNPQDKLMLSLTPNGAVNCPVGVTPALRPIYCPGGVFKLDGYRATAFNICEITNTCGNIAPPGCAGFTFDDWYKCDAVWAGAPSIVVPNPNPTLPPIATVSYLIQRMCSLTGPPLVGDPNAGQGCLVYTPPPTDKSRIPPPPSRPMFFYRVTSRSVGPRNSISYTQTIILISN